MQKLSRHPDMKPGLDSKTVGNNSEFSSCSHGESRSRSGSDITLDPPISPPFKPGPAWLLTANEARLLSIEVTEKRSHFGYDKHRKWPTLSAVTAPNPSPRRYLTSHWYQVMLIRAEAL